jgi:hypothetical protein
MDLGEPGRVFISAEQHFIANGAAGNGVAEPVARRPARTGSAPISLSTRELPLRKRVVLTAVPH